MVVIWLVELLAGLVELAVVVIWLVKLSVELMELVSVSLGPGECVESGSAPHPDAAGLLAVRKFHQNGSHLFPDVGFVGVFHEIAKKSPSFIRYGDRAT
ncbi:hypothetical protein PHYPSEUDO_004052 [Phytophthora pseudosyringae]|uniref:Uncharacterized protein n=1 Tax=Phytophthora pseudosyringae TaxID=221518 RepID=A0A8T1VS66_9STRA|nr:hypothetical protein PHYPSEUDO_004052 [Phytophthora pseudosyringae]